MLGITEKKTLSSQEIYLINKLLDSCRQEFEEIYTFLEAEENYNRDLSPYYLLKEADRLVGFMSVFVPDDTGCEVYINILQDYNSEKNVRYAVECIRNKCDKYKIRNISVIASAKNKKMTDNLQKIGLRYVYSDIGMYIELQDFFVRDSDEEDEKSIEAEGDSNNRVYTLWQKEEYVGELSVLKEQNTICVYGVYIDEKHRRKGYGRYLVAGMLQKEKYAGALKAVLHVTSDNIPAIKLYESIGFKEKEKIGRWEIV